MSIKRIIAVHLLNDFSGSPLVLRQSLETLANDFEVHLFTSTPSGKGILSNIPGVIDHNIFYRWYPNRWATLGCFFTAQFLLFLKLLFMLKKNDTVYINTLLPFAAALAGWIRGTQIIYHVHEVSIKPPALKSFIAEVANIYADKILFVSKFVKDQFDFAPGKTEVVYNSLPGAFIREAMKTVAPEKNKAFTVLMLCSLKAYKGIYEFVELAKQLPGVHFELVLNTSEKEKEAFQQETDAPTNCAIYSVQHDTSRFYKNAHLVVNLSRPDQWLETFGMTVLEGMYYGLPSIVPPVGGVTELITDGVEGLYADSNNIPEIASMINRLSTDQHYYHKLAIAAWCKAQRFSQSEFGKQIKSAFKHTNFKLGAVHAMEI
jgi:glycosyltransferase involved in cell wall biosynthesis